MTVTQIVIVAAVAGFLLAGLVWTVRESVRNSNPAPIPDEPQRELPYQPPYMRRGGQ